MSGAASDWPSAMALVAHGEPASKPANKPAVQARGGDVWRGSNAAAGVDVSAAAEARGSGGSGTEDGNGDALRGAGGGGGSTGTGTATGGGGRRAFGGRAAAVPTVYSYHRSLEAPEPAQPVAPAPQPATRRHDGGSSGAGGNGGGNGGGSGGGAAGRTVHYGASPWSSEAWSAGMTGYAEIVDGVFPAPAAPAAAQMAPGVSPSASCSPLGLHGSGSGSSSGSSSSGGGGGDGGGGDRSKSSRSKSSRSKSSRSKSSGGGSSGSSGGGINEGLDHCVVAAFTPHAHAGFRGGGVVLSNAGGPDGTGGTGSGGSVGDGVYRGGKKKRGLASSIFGGGKSGGSGGWRSYGATGLKAGYSCIDDDSSGLSAVPEVRRLALACTCLAFSPSKSLSLGR